MMYKVKYKKAAEKKLEKMDAPVRKRILYCQRRQTQRHLQINFYSSRRRAFYLFKMILPALLSFHLSPLSSKVAALSTRSRE